MEEEVTLTLAQAFCTDLVIQTKQTLSNETLRVLLVTVQQNNMAERTEYAITMWAIPVFLIS